MAERVVVITGATGGLGRVAARAFAEHGHSLALLSTDQKKLVDLAQSLELPPGRLYTQAVNVLHAGALQSADESVAARFGEVHVLIHLIGGWAGGKTLPETDPQQLEAMFAQHGRSTFNLIKAFVPQLVRSGWGRVLAVSPISASRPPGMNGAYAAAKSGQETLLLTLAEEFKGRGLTANVLQVRSIDAEHTGDGTTPEDLAAAMLYLCSDEAGKINGARIPLV